MKLIKAADVVVSLITSGIELGACVGLGYLFIGSVPAKWTILALLVLFVCNVVAQVESKPEEIKKVGKVIVNIEDPDKELLAIKLMVGEYDLITSDVIAFDVERES